MRSLSVQYSDRSKCKNWHACASNALRFSGLNVSFHLVYSSDDLTCFSGIQVVAGFSEQGSFDKGARQNNRSGAYLIVVLHISEMAKFYRILH